MKTLSFDTYSFMPYGNLQSKDITYLSQLTYFTCLSIIFTN